MLDVYPKHLDFVETDEDTDMHIFDQDGERVEVPCSFFGEKGAYIQGSRQGHIYD